MTEDSSELQLLANELKSLVGYGITPSKAESTLPRLRAALGVPEDMRPAEAARTLKRLLRAQLHLLSGDHDVFSKSPAPISSERLIPAYECLFHLTEPAQLKNARYSGLPQYERRRLYAIDKLAVHFPLRTWRVPDGHEHELMATLASVLLNQEAPRGRIDREEATYFLDEHGCAMRSEHVLIVTPLREGWKEVGPFIRQWRGYASLPAEFWSPLRGWEKMWAVARSMLQIIGSPGLTNIGLLGGDRVKFSIGLPPVKLHTPHTLAWTGRYDCRGDEATGKMERAEVVYTSSVSECVLRIKPDPAIKELIQVRSYDRLIPAGDFRRGEIGLGTDQYPSPDSTGSYEAEFRNLEPLRYYGLEWWWGVPSRLTDVHVAGDEANADPGPEQDMDVTT